MKQRMQKYGSILFLTLILANMATAEIEPMKICNKDTEQDFNICVIDKDIILDEDFAFVFENRSTDFKF